MLTPAAVYKMVESGEMDMATFLGWAMDREAEAYARGIDAGSELALIHA